MVPQPVTSFLQFLTVNNKPVNEKYFMLLKSQKLSH